MLPFTEKGKMKNSRFKSDNKEFSFGYVKFEITQTYPAGTEVESWLYE